MHQTVLAMVRERDTEGLSYFLSRELVNNGQFASTVNSASGKMKIDSFEIADEYYVVNKYITTDTITSDDKGAEAHKLIYPGATEEMYMVFYTPKEKLPNKWMITMIYSEFDYGWKLAHMTVSPYTINSKNAQQLYQSALAEYKQGYLINAFNDARMAASCLHPTRLWKYDNESEITKFFTKIQSETNSTFKVPMMFNKVKTRPGIIGFFNRTNNDGNFPIITYLTRINIKDTAAVHKENLEMRKYIGEMMPGVDKNKKFLFYQAYNTVPNFKTNTPSYEITQKLQ